MSVEFDLEGKIKALSREQLETLASNLSNLWFYDYEEEEWDFDLELDSDHLAGVTDILCSFGLTPPQMIMCDLCKEDTPMKTAHLHQGKYIGECCWDERLRTTE